MCVSHLQKVFNPLMLRRIAAEMESRRRKLGAEIVLARGLSGTLVATTMSALFHTPIGIVRKPDERSHSSRRIELVEERDNESGNYSFEHVLYHNYVIVDDLIASGRTVNEIIEAADHDKHIRGKCVGILLYFSDCDDEDIYAYNEERSFPVQHIGSVE